MMKRKKIIYSFIDAFSGIIEAFHRERNMGLHVLGALVALAASYYFRVEKLEFLFVITAIFFVFITELINTAVEAAVDLNTEDFHPLARTAKNVAAGAVLFAAVFSLIVAYMVFAEKLRGFW
ncbi:MAG TPA: diacylglycerol kinase family protein [Firmicutes bacterium]|jgi:diacylglycerol kinase (ATP)|nr:diacylglycerol kinase family protein [Bacillota bacterium]